MVFFIGAGNGNTQNILLVACFLSLFRCAVASHKLKKTSPVVQKQHFEVVFVPPALSGSIPLFLLSINKKAPQGCILFIGAGNGNRTRITSLGSSRSTIELCLRLFMSATIQSSLYFARRFFALKNRHNDCGGFLVVLFIKLECIAETTIYFVVVDSATFQFTHIIVTVT